MLGNKHFYSFRLSTRRRGIDTLKVWSQIPQEEAFHTILTESASNTVFTGKLRCPLLLLQATETSHLRIGDPRIAIVTIAVFVAVLSHQSPSHEGLT